MLVFTLPVAVGGGARVAGGIWTWLPPGDAAWERAAGLVGGEAVCGGAEVPGGSWTWLPPGDTAWGSVAGLWGGEAAGEAAGD